MKIEDIRQILIVGAGTMGLEIGLQCARYGYEVVLYDLWHTGWGGPGYGLAYRGLLGQDTGRPPTAKERRVHKAVRGSGLFRGQKRARLLHLP